VKISVRVGLIVGALLVAVGLFLNFRSGNAMALKPVHFYATALIFLIGPSLTRWLNRDVHLRNVGGNQPGMVSGFLLGFAFAFGWTPCIGPILGGVLLIASTKNTVGEGIFLLACYSAGLAIPFLLFAVGIGRFMKFYTSFRKYVHWVEVGSGVLLLLFGGLVFFNELTMVSSKLAFFQPENLIVIAKGKSPSNVSTASSQPSASPTALANEPDVTFKDLQGNDVALSSLKGKVVLVNFWGTWCEPCRGEIPILIKMQQAYSSKGFTILGVATNDDEKAVDPFIHNTQFNVDGHQMTMNYPIVMGSDDISTKFGGLLGMPTSFLISRDGKIIKRYIGAFANADEINKEVESHL
jgi:cytochrome c-type biogenesis protein